MSEIFNQIKIVLLLIMVIPVFAYGSYTITPVVLNIKKGVMVSSLSVTNNKDDASYFQLEIYESDENRQSQNPTKDVIAAPSMFKINGKKTQIIRIAIKNQEAVFNHKYYVLSIKELHHGENQANTIKFIKNYRIPITFGDDTPIPENK